MVFRKFPRGNSFPKHRARSILLAVCACAVLLWAGDLGFDRIELDGNAVDNTPGAAPADFGSLYDAFVAGGAPGETVAGQIAFNFVAEPNINTSIFQGGGSKDDLDISNWLWKDNAGGLPAKDNLLNSSAVGFIKNGDFIVALHADRWETDGSAEMGFWLFQNEVSLSNTASQGGFKFNGVHAVGDVFVRATFTNGGSVVAITVDRWNGTGLTQLFDSTQAVCNPATSQRACGLTNAIATASPWPYQARNHPTANQFPPLTYFEVSLNITQLFQSAGAPAPSCFASFMAETRSSHTVDATLKDFVLGAFPVCSIAISKNCQCTSFDPAGPNTTLDTGYNYSFSGTVTNNGAGTLHDVQVTDKGKTYSCGQLGPGASKNFPSADCTGPPATFSSANFPTTNQASVTAKTSATGGSTVTDQTDPVSCATESALNSCTPDPRLTLDKQCVTALQVSGSNVVVRVDYTGKVYNNGTVNLTNVQVTEDHNAPGVDQTFSVGLLGAQTSKCYTNLQGADPTVCPTLTLPSFGAPTVTGAASYFPSSGTGVNPGRVQFTDKVRATGVNPFGGATIESHPATGGFSATCAVCPFGACPAQ